MTNRLLLAAIADDYTGGSDMAGMLAGEGVRTVQTFGVPDGPIDDAEAVVVSLKSRSIPSAEAVRVSLTALETLQSLAPAQVQFKYCSTFDSTKEGNIGPVTAALMERLGTDFTVAVPVLPVNGRTQYFGYLFVNGVLLSESPMRHHPLNPMTEPNLVRHLQAQTSRRIGLIDLPHVRQGNFRRPDECEIALVDAIDEDDLRRIAAGVADLPLITGGSGISKALPAVWREQRGWMPHRWSRKPAARGKSKALLLAGSCSAATLRQLDVWQASGHPAERMNADSPADPEVMRLLQWCEDAWRTGPYALVYSSAPPDGRSGDASAIEHAFGQLAQKLNDRYGRLVVAGGETSGAVVEALGIKAVEIGDGIDPGVPALTSRTEPPLRLALKSGNFGCPEFFEKAARFLE